MTWLASLKLSLLCLLPAVIASLDSEASPTISSEPYDNNELIQTKDLLHHLHYQHGLGNNYPSFTLSIDTPTVLEVDVIQSRQAISPAALYSINDRPSREVGHLGYYHLVSPNLDEFVLLTVNRVDGSVRGVVKEFDGGWIVVDEANSKDLEERSLQGDNDLQIIETGTRKMQANSDYIYQINLHFDIDYTLVKNNNGGSLCNVLNYINSLVTAANAILEREIMTHINVKYIQQTTFYDSIDSTMDVLEKMKNEFGNDDWNDKGIDLHYALLGKRLRGGIGERSGIAFIEDSLCNEKLGFGVVSGLEGGFDAMDERFGSDLKRFMYAFGHNLGKGRVISGDLESLLFTYGGQWSRMGDMHNVRSWIDNPLLDSSTNPRQVPFDIFKSLNEKSGSCLEEVRTNSDHEDDSMTGECLPEIPAIHTGSSVLFLKRGHFITRAQAVPSKSPSKSPSRSPSASPSISTSPSISNSPSQSPSVSASPSISLNPSISPSRSSSPSISLSPSRSLLPSISSSPSASNQPSKSPSGSPSVPQSPTKSPSKSPSNSILAPTFLPSYYPTYRPTEFPTFSLPTDSPTSSPTESKSAKKSKGGKNSNSKTDKGGKDGKEGKSEGGKTGKQSKVIDNDGDSVTSSNSIIASPQNEELKETMLDEKFRTPEYTENDSSENTIAMVEPPTYFPTYSPSYFPTYPPSYFPTYQPTYPPTPKPVKQSKASKQNDSKGGKDSKNSNDGKSDSKSGKDDDDDNGGKTGKESKVVSYDADLDKGGATSSGLTFTSPQTEEVNESTYRKKHRIPEGTGVAASTSKTASL